MRKLCVRHYLFRRINSLCHEGKIYWSCVGLPNNKLYVSLSIDCPSDLINKARKSTCCVKIEDTDCVSICSLMELGLMYHLGVHTLGMVLLVFWVVTPCGFVGRYKRFGGTYFLHLQD
jgi:hypothetical protein